MKWTRAYDALSSAHPANASRKARYAPRLGAHRSEAKWDVLRNDVGKDTLLSELNYYSLYQWVDAAIDRCELKARRKGNFFTLKLKCNPTLELALEEMVWSLSSSLEWLLQLTSPNAAVEIEAEMIGHHVHVQAKAEAPAHLQYLEWNKSTPPNQAHSAIAYIERHQGMLKFTKDGGEPFAYVTMVLPSV